MSTSFPDDKFVLLCVLLFQNSRATVRTWFCAQGNMSRGEDSQGLYVGEQAGWETKAGFSLSCRRGRLSACEESQDVKRSQVIQGTHKNFCGAQGTLDSQ